MQNQENHQLLKNILNKTSEHNLHKIIDSFIEKQDKLNEWQFYCDTNLILKNIAQLISLIEMKMGILNISQVNKLIYNKIIQ